MCTTRRREVEKIKMECPEKFRHLLFRVNANEKVEITQESTTNVVEEERQLFIESTRILEKQQQ